VWMTAPDPATAERIGRALVEERLAACATAIPGVRSVYRWEGAVQAGEEVQVVLKTRRALLGTLFARAAELHPYEVPELVATPFVGVAGAYRSWVLDETGPPGGGAEPPQPNQGG